MTKIAPQSAFDFKRIHPCKNIGSEGPFFDDHGGTHCTLCGEEMGKESHLTPKDREQIKAFEEHIKNPDKAPKELALICLECEEVDPEQPHYCYRYEVSCKDLHFGHIDTVVWAYTPQQAAMKVGQKYFDEIVSLDSDTRCLSKILTVERLGKKNSFELSTTVTVYAEPIRDESI